MTSDGHDRPNDTYRVKWQKKNASNAQGNEGDEPQEHFNEAHDNTPGNGGI